MALLIAYRSHGGLARHRDGTPAGDAQPAPTLAATQALIDDGLVFAFRWHDALWLPLFQLDADRLSVAAGPQRVVAELGDGFDAWSLAQWFVRPNNCLDDHLPVDCLHTRLYDVLQAAREDRFVSMG